MGLVNSFLLMKVRMKIVTIAELAQGFEGRPEQARLLMKAAAAIGLDTDRSGTEAQFVRGCFD
jgi:hypothetical protein